MLQKNTFDKLQSTLDTPPIIFASELITYTFHTEMQQRVLRCLADCPDSKDLDKDMP